MALDKMSLIELAKANARASLNPSVAYNFEGQSMTADALNDIFLILFSFCS